MEWVTWKCNKCNKYKFTELTINGTYFIGYKSICNWCKICNHVTETEVIEITPED